MKHGLIFLLTALALIALCVILWDAYSEVAGDPLLGSFAPLLFLISSIVFLGTSVSLALVLAQGRRRKGRRRHLAPYFARRTSRRATPPEMLPSGVNHDPQAWDENESLPRGNEL
jgi:hypothetical protein